MSNNNNNLDKNNDKNKNNNKNLKISINKTKKDTIKKNITFDLSKSPLIKKDISNNILFSEFSLLHTCKKQLIMPPINTKKKKSSFLNKTNLNINNDEFNMTIKKILDNLRDKRLQNKKTLYRRKDNEMYKKIKTSLDNNRSLDPSNSQIIMYKPLDDKEQALNKFLVSIKEESDKFGTLFNNDFRTRTRSKSLYYPHSKRPYYPPPPKPIIKKTKVNIKVEIDSLEDLLKLIDDYPLKPDVEYNINMKSIHNIKKPLLDLKRMIGMRKLKNSVVDQILYFIQDFHKNSYSKNQDFLHTVIYGPPGTGKTETAKIIGNIFSKLGILSRNYFRKATRADLIAGYLGQTALKTKDIIKECTGGVLFIDEAYALGNPEKRDSFAKECIDTLCEALSDNKDNLMVIIAGYEKELKECFFAYNQGLESRFTWRFNTDDYTYEELFLIFSKKVEDIGWTINKNINKNWFENKMDKFLYFGRDIETLLAKVKIAHGRRVFCLPKEEKMKISLRDMDKGLSMFLDNSDKNRNDDMTKHILNHMYC